MVGLFRGLPGWTERPVSTRILKEQDMSKPKSEKRTAPRVAVEKEVTVKVINGKAEDVDGQLRDVSMRGVFVYLQSRVAEGSTIEVVMPLPNGIGQAGTWVRCKCRVVRVEETDDTHEFGVAAMIEELETIDDTDLPEA